MLSPRFKAPIWWVATFVVLAVACASCDGSDDKIDSRTVLWNSTSEQGPATVFIIRDFTDFQSVRDRVPDRAGLFDWPSLDFARFVFVVYIDGESQTTLSREGMYIHDVRVEDGELVLTLDPQDDLVADDSDIQWWDVQTIAVSPSDLPPGRGVRVVTPDGRTLAAGR